MVLSEIRREARSVMQGQWGACVPIWLIYLIIMAVPGIVFRSGSSSFVQFGISLLLGGPITYSITKIFFRVYRHEQVEIGQLFEGFNEFTRTFTAYALITLYTILWSLLLIVPGIIAGLGYSMTFLIMAENPTISATEAMRQSKEMMMGHKWELFLLGASFIGWVILGILTFCIGLLWVESYIYTAIIVFYHKIRGVQDDVILHSSGVNTPVRETIFRSEEPVVQPEETIAHTEEEPIN